MKIILCFVMSLVSSASEAQLALKEVQGLPTNELYDLHLDRRGYLWIAHDLGISRFDGLNFIHFSNPAQASLSITDIAEDSQGRIWCHNFSGQIFYIEQGQMKLLETYDYAKESHFTRIAISGDELVATSDQGIFVCSTTDFKHKYISIKTGKKEGVVSLAAIAKRTVLLVGENWWVYQKGKGIKPLKSDGGVNLKKMGSVSLQPNTYGNLLFLISNPLGIPAEPLYWVVKQPMAITQGLTDLKRLFNSGANN